MGRSEFKPIPWHFSGFEAVPYFKPGDPPPRGYMAWHDWAHIQHKAGLRQRQCPECLRWLFPQEFKGHACKG